MGAVPLGGGPPMAPLPPLQQLGFGNCRCRLQGNATLDLRAGGRGHQSLFLAAQESAPGTKRTWPEDGVRSAFDPKRTYRGLKSRSAAVPLRHQHRRIGSAHLDSRTIQICPKDLPDDVRFEGKADIA